MAESSLNILMIVLSTVSPDVRVEKEARSLAQEGHNVTILAIDRNGTLPSEERREGYKIIRFRSKRKLFFKYFEFWRKVRNYMKDKFFDVIHFHDLNVLPLSSKLRKHGKILVYDSHELFPELMSETYGKLAYWVFTFLERHYMKYIDGVITPGLTYHNHFQRKYNRGDIWIYNYPSIIDVNKARGIEIPNQYKKKKSFRVVYFGVMYYNIGYDKLVQAVELIKEHISPADIEFLIIGSGVAYNSMKKQIEKEQLENYFHLTGWMDYLLALSVMRTCDVGLILFQPSENNYSRIPNRLYEYFSAGIPFIGSDFPGLRKGSEYKKSLGIFIDPTRPEEIAKAILELYNNKEKLQQMKDAAIEAFQTTFNWENEVKKLIEFYRNLLTIKS